MERRQFLRGAAALGTIGSIGTAGCTDLNPLSSDESESLEEVTQWLPDPNWIDSDLEHGRVNILQHSEIADDIDNPFWIPSVSMEVAEVLPEDVAQEIEFSIYPYDIRVLLGEFDADWIDSRFLEGDEYSFATDYDDFEVYTEDTDTPLEAYAIRSDAYIEVESAFGDAIDDSIEDLIEDVIDAKNGDVDRFIESVDAAETLVDTLELDHEVDFETDDRIEDESPEDGRFLNQTGGGAQTTDRQTYEEVVEVLAFRSDSDAADAEIDDYINSGEFSSAVTEPTVEVEENVVRIEYQRS